MEVHRYRIGSEGNDLPLQFLSIELLHRVLEIGFNFVLDCTAEFISQKSLPSENASPDSLCLAVTVGKGDFASSSCKVLEILSSP